MHLRSLIACIAVAPFVIGASHPLRLSPSSEWVLEHKDTSCRLVRTFGEGNKLTKLVLKSLAPGNLTMIIRGDPVRASIGRQVRTRFLPVDDKPFYGAAARAADGQSVVLSTRVPLLEFNQHDDAGYSRAVEPPKKRSSGRPPPIDVAKLAAVATERQALLSTMNEIEIDAYHAAILEVGSMAAPIATLDHCERDILHELGLDPEIQGRIVRPVWIPDITRWISSSDYPVSALWRGRQAKVEVRLVVDSAGKVTSCTTLTDYNAADFERAVCAALSHAVFMPAELGDGTKVPSYYANTVFFKMAP